MTKPFFQFKKIAFSIFVFAAVFPCVAFAQQVSARQVAGLMEDVSALRSEVQRLRAEVEDLRSENARLLDRAGSAQNSRAQSEAALATLRVELNNKSESLRREINSETDKKIQKLANEINSVLADFRKQVNASLGAGENRGTPSTPVARPKDLPENAIKYTVKPGDTLSKIAVANGSKVQWILFVNEGLNPNKISVGAQIFVPVKE